ncbi:MAG: hypothetical protein RL131_918, partial [Bacteroidota bacterium]
MGRKNKQKQRKKEYKPAQRAYRGKFEVTRSGMGFVVVEGLDKDIIVRPHDFNKAFHGDTVRVEVTKGDMRIGRLQGKIIQVIERLQKEFIGVLELNRDFGFFIPQTDKPIPDFFIPLDKVNGAKDGDKVFARMISWDEDDKRPKGEIIEVASAEREGDMAMKEILVQQGFSLSFNDEVVEETLRIPETITREEIALRRDMRNTLSFTIDPEDAKDFDDALSFSKLEADLFEIGIHIADVSHYIQPETALDSEAYERGTSVYLPDRVVPMLPERISNELCSLRPHEDKLTYSCVFKINSKAEIKHVWMGRTVTHSNHRFTYEQVQEIIEGKTGLYEKEIHLLHKLAQQFRAKRMKNGAINFSSQEVRFRLDEKGIPIGIVIKESKFSHQLIEEFMLLANRTVAEKVSQVKVSNKPIPFPYRVHNQPDEEKLLPFVEFARKYGYVFSTQTPNEIARSFNEMLSRVQGLPEQRVLEQLGIRTMAKAIYTV